MAVVKVEFEGFYEFAELTKEIVDDFGEKDAKKILVSAMRRSMRSVLDAAKMRSPVDTGALQESLQIEARKPTVKDRRSKYITQGDIVIAAVTTAPGKKLAKKKFFNQRTGKIQIGIHSDARATANEFGTANMGAKPFMRPALESNQGNVTNNLGDSLKVALEKYKARQAKKVKI